MPVVSNNLAVPGTEHGPVSAESPASSSSMDSKKPTPSKATTLPEAGWGANFWVTLTDPLTGSRFYANPSTGQTSWDPPVGNFVLPPSEEGEWWELIDESRGIPYYHQTKTGETVWERPEGFVIPLGILQNTSLGRRVSLNASKRISLLDPSDTQTPSATSAGRRPSYQRSHSSPRDQGGSPSSASGRPRHSRQSSSNDFGRKLTPIPGSPTPSGASAPATPVSSTYSLPLKKKDSPGSKSSHSSRRISANSALDRNRSKSSSNLSARKPQPPQSLSAAVEMISIAQTEIHGGPSMASTTHIRVSTSPQLNGSTKSKGKHPSSPRRPIPAVPGTSMWTSRNTPSPSIHVQEISQPILNKEAAAEMSPIKQRNGGKPIPVASPTNSLDPNLSTITLPSSRAYPILPHDLASEIQQFSESQFAKQYFSTHRRGFIFRRKVPVAQMMQWQKAPLTSPLLTLKRELQKDAVKIFRIIQYIMGDREKDKTMIVRSETLGSTVPSLSSSVSSTSSAINGTLEQQRWILAEGITHGELRDEIYCQIMKQLTGNTVTESIFKGWQLLCVVLNTFPPSKNFEANLRSFMQQRTSQSEARVDVMAKYCLKRLDVVSRKGPKGKPPTLAEIEIAADAAFNPSIFGETLGSIIRLQERSYPHQMVPVILPFLADGILALGGNRSEGIFRVPGDGDSVSSLKLAIDQGYYSLPDGVSDPHVLASLMKLWLRELADPLVPEEMYNECITTAKDAQGCVKIVGRLPTINRRVVIFLISFLQLFLDDKTQASTKMTPANLALVMAPNILRCNSESMTVVFTNAQFEQEFVHNLLLYMEAGSVDPDYAPVHGQGSAPPAPRSSNKFRRN